MLSLPDMDSHHRGRRLVKSPWVQIGFVLIALELLTVAAAVATGDWDLAWVFAALFVFMLFRGILFAVFILWPVLIVTIVVWAALRRAKEKQEKEANREPSTGEKASSSNGAQ